MFYYSAQQVAKQKQLQANRINTMKNIGLVLLAVVIAFLFAAFGRALALIQVYQSL